MLQHSINIRVRQLEGVPQQFKTRWCSLRENHFDDVEPKQDVGITQEPEPGKAASRNALALVPIDRVERPAEIFPRPRFHFDENQRVAIAANEIDFATGAPAKITIQDLVTVPAQELAGQFLPPRAKSQMLGTRIRKPAAPPVRKIVDESDKARVHAVLSGAAPCRSPCAG